MDEHEQSIKIHYNGSGDKIKQHQMKVSLVTSSMSGLETIYLEAFKEANRIYSSHISTEALLSGGFRDGSLWWLIKLFTKESESQQSFETSSIYGAICAALNKTIELLKNMDLSTTEIVIKQGKQGYSIDIDGDRVELNELECAILTNPKIRAAISDISTPLTEEGIDSLTINQGAKEHPLITVTKEDKEKLVIRRNHKHVVDEGKIFGFFYVENLSYNPKAKWKLIDRDNPARSLTALIVDPVFLKRVSDNQEKFSKDDLLEVDGVWYKEKTKLTGKTITNYTITKVIQHIPVEDKQWKLM
ncbi:hypothetical protein GCM10011369_26750 [Neiella marina]|uniref:Uncharacterized protein n=1 Tax=Neiella marina TaxID=508461 RepID=A0A8J2U712_9GAMM|nr:hypothetical protein [Neiella marina]GGA83411.1 hypothetical protein GCM10011369_26750 [Neiella marina]